MSRKKAHLILVFADLLCLFAFFLGYTEIKQVYYGIENSAHAISFSNRAGLPLVCIVMPLVHFFPLYEYFWPGKLKKYSSLINRSFLAIGICLILMAFLVSIHIKTYVESAGYFHCHKADEPLSFSTYLVYTKDASACRQLIEENRRGMRAISN